MYGFRYSEWDPSKVQKLQAFSELMNLFNYLLIKYHGDPDEALETMKYLQQRGYIAPEVDLDEFREMLEDQEIIEGEEGGGFGLTDLGVRKMRQSSLDQMFRNLKAGGPGGGHQTSQGGGMSTNDALPEQREYRFGDEIQQINFNASILNSIKRAGADATLSEDDLIVQDTEYSTACATVLLLDVSHSMILYGEDRFTPAKQVALALTELIITKYPKDTLDIILFGNDAIPVAIKDLPFAQVGPYHTNTKAGLVHARKVLERRKNPNKQIFMVTDGKPTVVDIPGEGRYRNTFGLDPIIINKTLDEAAICRRRGIRITTFMVTRDPYLEDFVLQLTELNKGRAYFSDPENLGGFLFMDFIRNRRRNQR